MKPPRRRYTREFKEMVVGRLESIPVAVIAKENGLPPTVLHRWWREFGAHETKSAPVRRRYPREFKTSAVELLKSGLPIETVAIEKKISLELLRRWYREFGKFGERAFSGYGRSRVSAP